MGGKEPNFCMCQLANPDGFIKLITLPLIPSSTLPLAYPRALKPLLSFVSVKLSSVSLLYYNSLDLFCNRLEKESSLPVCLLHPGEFFFDTSKNGL